MTPFAELPDVLLIAEVAELMRVTKQSIYNRLYEGRFLPLPFAEKPYRWLKTDVERWLNGEFREADEKLRAAARKRRRKAA